MGSQQGANQSGFEEFLPLEKGALYLRHIGHGKPLLVLHGGPDFSHDYLLPDLDRLADAFRLIYYDQRGRGRSAAGVAPEDVSLESEVADLDAVRTHAGLHRIALLGHSWGALLALEYAVRHPERVSHLILLNAAPVSYDDLRLLRQERQTNSGEDMEALKRIRATRAYQAGEMEAVEAHYRIHFRATVRRPEQMERLIAGLRPSFQPACIHTARAVEDRLYDQTWRRPDYSLMPLIGKLAIPALVLHGDYDFVPVTCATHIAEAIPGARLVVLHNCGHFSYMERPDEVHSEVARFLGNT